MVISVSEVPMPMHVKRKFVISSIFFCLVAPGDEVFVRTVPLEMFVYPESHLWLGSGPTRRFSDAFFTVDWWPAVF